MSGKIDFIHIGLPKTGSTYLQKVFFRQHPEINCLGSGTSQSVDKEFILLVRKMVNGQSFLHESDEIRRRLKDLLIENKGAKKDCVNGISAEGLSQTIYDSKMVTHVACMLHEIAPEAKILIFVRNQRDMIDSFYRQYIVEGGNKKIDEFLLSPLNWMSPDYSNYVEDALDVQGINRFKYYGVVKTYIDIFGEDNVYIGLQELLKKNRDFSFKEISNFLNINDHKIIHQDNVNSKKSKLQYELLRYVNNFFCSEPKRSFSFIFASLMCFFANKIKSGKYKNKDKNKYYGYMREISSVRSFIRQKVMGFSFKGDNKRYYDDLNKDISDYIEKQYANDNKNLSLFCRYDLKKYGYFL